MKRHLKNYGKGPIKCRDYLFKKLTEKISEKDFTGYTIQYPPLLTWDKLENKICKEWQKISPEDKLGIYIHIPFCEQKCIFCRYYSKKEKNKKVIESYLRFLEKEIMMYRRYLANKQIHSLYIGGGTPTIFTLQPLAKLLSILKSNFLFSEDAQMCIEVTPQSLDLKKLLLLKRFGINRLTIGVQSLNKNVLKEVGRLQNPKEAIKLLGIAKGLGFQTVNIDLMAGLPKETLSSFKRGLDKTLKKNPDMVHIHPFYPIKYTEFMKSGCYLSKCEMDLRTKMCELADKTLRSRGFCPKKFDAYGKKDDSRNIQLCDAIENISSYIGFGAGAVSHIRGSLRYVNHNDVCKYISCIKKKVPPIMKGINLTKRDEMIYYLTACLRYGYVLKSEFRRIFGKEVTSVFSKELAYLKKRGIVHETDEKIVIKVKNIGEYLVFSKYFYDDEIIEICKQHMDKLNIPEREITLDETRYMCL